MRAKFENVFRWYVAGLILLLLGSLWVAAQSAGTSTATKPADGAKAAVLNEEWLSFGLNRFDILQEPVMGRPLWQYYASILYILLAFAVAKLLDWLVGRWLKQWAAKTETKFDDLLLDLLHGPVKVITLVILLHIGLRVYSWPLWIAEFCSKALHVVVAISLTYLAVKCVDLLIAYWKERAVSEDDKSIDEMLFPVIRKSLKVFVIVVAVLVTSQNLGVNITGVLASLSIGGLALGLAAQDTLANLFGALAVLLDKPFRIGDRIKLDQVDGTVEVIGLRSTRVRNLDGHLITIPNKTMGNATITNVTRRPNIKTEMNLGITYDTPPEKVKRALAILEEVYRANPKTYDLVISFNRFADSALNILVVHWWGSTDQNEYLAGMQQFNLAIKERFDAEGIEFAFPSQTHYVKQVGK